LIFDEILKNNIQINIFPNIWFRGVFFERNSLTISSLFWTLQNTPENIFVTNFQTELGQIPFILQEDILSLSS